MENKRNITDFLKMLRTLTLQEMMTNEDEEEQKVALRVIYELTNMITEYKNKEGRYYGR